MGLQQRLKSYTDRNLHGNLQITLDHSVTFQLFLRNTNKPTYPRHIWTIFFWTTASFHHVLTTETIEYLNSYAEDLRDLKSMDKRIQLCYVRLHEKIQIK